MLVLILLLILLVTGFDVLNVEAEGQRQIRLPVPHQKAAERLWVWVAGFESVTAFAAEAIEPTFSAPRTS
jgi:hypothetical protein